MIRRCLVTGATGFSGKYLCSALSRAGFEVFGTTLGQSAQTASRFHLLSIDLRASRKVDSLIKKIRPHFLFHLAAQSSARGSWNLQSETFASNVGCTVNLLNAIRKAGLHTRFILASSVQVYGRMFSGNIHINEKNCVFPENPYAWSKRAAELSALEFSSRFGLQVMIARIVNHTGRGQDPHYVFPDWCRQIALAERRKESIRLSVGDLTVERDFLHVGDVIQAYLILARRGIPGEIYNVASSRAVRLSRYIEYLQQSSSVSIETVTDSSRVRPDEPRRALIDSSKLRRLGWKPRQDVRDAITELMAEWRHKVTA